MFNLDWKTAVCGGACLFVGGLFLWLTLSRAQLKVELATLQGDMRVCLSTNADWGEKAKTVQSAIDALKTADRKREQKAVLAQKKAAASAVLYEKQAAHFLSRAAGPSDRCAQALALARSYLQEQGGARK